MTFSVAFYLTPIGWVAAGIVVVLLAASEAGWRVGRRHWDGDETFRGLVGGMAAATLGLLGLLLGFTLSMAIARFDARRAVIVEEANAIGTLWLRADLLDQPLATELRETLRDYTRARLDLGRVGNSVERLRDARARSAALQQTLWTTVQQASASSASPAVVSAVIGAANAVIDLDELRMSSIENFVPAPIILMLIGVAALAFAFLGWSFGAANRRSVLSIVLLALLVTMVIVAIQDLNRPHRGIMRAGDQSLVRLGRSIGVR